jgi:hypothetical protein
VVEVEVGVEVVVEVVVEVEVEVEVGVEVEVDMNDTKLNKCPSCAELRKECDRLIRLSQEANAQKEEM